MDYLIEIKVLHPSQPISEVSLATLTRYGVKLGRTMQNDEWRKLWDKLMRDPDFEPKGAAEKWERKPNEPTIFK